MAACLIIEDSEVIRFIARRIFETIGYEAFEAENVDQAIELCQLNTPDIVLLDWDLPEFGALDFLKQFSLKEKTTQPEVILCATEHDPKQFALAKAAGVGHFLMKPFDISSIKALLDKIEMASCDTDLDTSKATTQQAS
ncbi:MAG: response regulator [bacterium]